MFDETKEDAPPASGDQNDAPSDQTSDEPSDDKPSDVPSDDAEAGDGQEKSPE